MALPVPSPSTGWLHVLTDAVSRALRKHPARSGNPAVTINRSAEDVYLMLRKVERMPALVEGVEAVDAVTSTTSHWVMRIPGGGRREWDLEITHAVDDQLIEWCATAGGKRVTGAVTLTTAPARTSTEVRVEVDRGERSDAGLVTRLFAAPVILEALRKLKQVLETGEVLQSDATLHRAPHPAQPSSSSGGGAS